MKRKTLATFFIAIWDRERILSFFLLTFSGLKTMKKVREMSCITDAKSSPNLNCHKNVWERKDAVKSNVCVCVRGNTCVVRSMRKWEMTRESNTWFEDHRGPTPSASMRRRCFFRLRYFLPSSSHWPSSSASFQLAHHRRMSSWSHPLPPPAPTAIIRSIENTSHAGLQ